MSEKINLTIDIEEFSEKIAKQVFNSIKESMEPTDADCETIKKNLEDLKDDEFLIFANDSEEEEKNEDIENYERLLDILCEPEFDGIKDLDRLYEWLYRKKHREELYGKENCVSDEELTAILTAATHFKKCGDISLYETLMGLYDRKFKKQ